MSIVQETWSTPDGEMPVSIAAPSDTGRAAIIVLHQAGGISPQILKRIESFAEQGYYAVAPHLFYREGVSQVDFSQFEGDLTRFSRWLSGDAQLLPDLTAIIDHLVASGFELDQIGVVGFSWGGRAAYLAAVNWELGAAVTYYGNGIHAKSFDGNADLQPLSKRGLLTPWLGLYGEDDQMVSPEEYREFEAIVTPKGGRMVRYPGAGHAFDVPEGPQHHEESAADAERRTDEFFEDLLVERSID